jgi:hypothetical protein
MRVQSINNLNFKSFLPSKQQGEKDGWDELERLCSSDVQKGILYEQLNLLQSNGDRNFLALEHTPETYSFANESFSFRLYDNQDKLELDRKKPYMVPQYNMNKELLIDFYGNHTYKITYGQLYSVKHHEDLQKEKANILLNILKNIVSRGSKENSAIFGKVDFGVIPKEIVSKFRL